MRQSAALLGLAGGILLAAGARADVPRPAQALGTACADPAGGAVEDRRALVAVGACWWTRAPDPRSPVACATCHDDPVAVRPWAASFPKFKPEPPPDDRVMTLLQANAEAVRRHYRLPDPRPVATAITAYLTWLGAEVPVSPGVSAGQPVFADRLRKLTRSAARGQRLYAARCAACHAPAGLIPAIARFPRPRPGGPQSVEAFLEAHDAGERALRWSDPAMADLLAYLASHAAGRPLSVPGTPDPLGQEVP